MARIHVYPPFRVLVGQDSLQLDLPEACSVRTMLHLLADRFPEFREFAEAPTDEFLWGQLIVHVNQEQARLGDPVRQDDRVDLLPTIAGG